MIEVLWTSRCYGYCLWLIPTLPEEPVTKERTEALSARSSVIPAVLCERLLCDRLAEPMDRDETDRSRSILTGISPTKSRRLERRSR